MHPNVLSSIIYNIWKPPMCPPTEDGLKKMVHTHTAKENGVHTHTHTAKENGAHTHG